MNFVFDESVGAPIAERLRQEGHRVDCVWDLSPSVSDDVVLEMANSRDAVLVTADKDFGELVFRLKRANRGVLLLRLSGLSTELKIAVVSELVRKHGDAMLDAFTVVTPSVVRVRRKDQ